MLPFKRILFPVDYSDLCRAVIPDVEDIVAHFSAQLIVVRAFTNTDWLKQVEEQEERQLRQFVAEAFPSRHVDSFLEEGDPASAIDKVVRHQGADLVMIPTHGRGPGPRIGLGSVTAKVLHDVTVPAWTRTDLVMDPRPDYIGHKRIVCAVRFNEGTEAVLRSATTLAVSYHADLSLVHVVDTPTLTDDAMDEANDRLVAWKQKLGIDAPHEVLRGMTAEIVRSEATRQAADLLVIGRGQIQGTLSRLWSPLYEIVRESRCPVLSI